MSNGKNMEHNNTLEKKATSPKINSGKLTKSLHEKLWNKGFFQFLIRSY